MKFLLFALAVSFAFTATANAQTATTTQNKEDGKEQLQNTGDTTTHSKRKHELKAAWREEKKEARHNKITDTTKQTKKVKADNKAVKRDEAASRKNGAKSANNNTYPLRKHH